MTEIRAAYQPIKNFRREIILDQKGEKSLTKQSHAKQLDVNTIIKKYNQTGVLQKMTDFEGQYGEFDEFDLATAIEKVQSANELFMEIPSQIRGQFENNPGKFIEFATDQANLQQMRDWGLAEPERGPQVPPEPQKVVIVQDTTQVQPS